MGNTKEKQNNNIQSLKGNRYSNMELLKVLAIFMIVGFHYVWNAQYSWSEFGVGTRIAVDIIYMFGELGVNIFVLISGYFMVNPKHKARVGKITALWRQILFYSVGSAAVLYVLNPYPFDLRTVLNIICPVSFNVWWYATAYLLLYIFSPYINKLLLQLSKKEYQRLLLVQLVIFCVIPTFFGVLRNDTESFLYYNRFIWMIVIYCIGGYIRLFGLSIAKVREEMQAAGWLAIHMVMWGLIIAFIVQRECFSNIWGGGSVSAIYFWQPNNILMLVLSISIFCFFNNIRMREVQIINYLASTTFGIYLIHGGRSGKIWWNRIFHNPEYAGSAAVLLEWICAVIIIMAVGIAVESVRQIADRHAVVPVVSKFRHFIRSIIDNFR